MADNSFLTGLLSPDVTKMAGVGLLNLSQNKPAFSQNNPVFGNNAENPNSPTNTSNIGTNVGNILKLFGHENPNPQPINGTNPGYQLPANNPIANTGDSLSRLVNAIGQTESGGNYGSLGTITNGDRAYGRYQVMGANIPAWSKEVLGRSMTPQEYLNDPHAQDAIAHAKLGQYLAKYGNINDAASMWFSGRPSKGNTSRDALGTSVPGYIASVNKYY